MNRRKVLFYLKRSKDIKNGLFQVKWDGDNKLDVSVPAKYRNKVGGLCGNFNGKPDDDLQLRNGQVANSDAAFGNDWKV